MKVLVVFDHPRRDSFCGAVADSLMAGLRSAGHLPELANLRAEDFDPRLPVGKDIVKYQKRRIKRLRQSAG